MEKFKYTKEDYQELKSWFEANDNLLSGDMQIDDSTYTPDIKKTILMLLEQAGEYHDNDKMYGGYLLLLRIKRMLEAKYR